MHEGGFEKAAMEAWASVKQLIRDHRHHLLGLMLSGPLPPTANSYKRAQKLRENPLALNSTLQPPAPIQANNHSSSSRAEPTA